MIRTLATTLIFFLSLSISAQPRARHVAPARLPQNTRELLVESMELMDRSYDPQAHLVFHPHDAAHQDRGIYMVRESSWYALGLLMRDAPTDRARAIGILNAVLHEQYLDPATKWYGTFKRSPEEPLPAMGTIAFTGYDPNWRHFIGTTFQIILIEYSSRLPAELAERLYRSIDAAIEGEMHDGRLVPSYTNIALMYGALWDFAAVHDQRAAWKQQAVQWTESVYSLFQPNQSFAEYNAPTYCGVDLYGLALWRDYGSTARIRHLGVLMESALWTDLSNFYQPLLRNLAGPYDRAYGMDMSVYVTPTGDWLRTVLDAGHAPLPEHLTLTTFQVADIWFAPHIAVLGTRIPKPALAKFRHFTGPHLVHRQIDAQRIATAWVGSEAMWGGEFTSLTRDTGRTQFHPVDVQWRMPSGAIGWIQLSQSPNLDAVADPQGVSISTSGEVVFKIFAERTPEFTATSWNLPGLSVEVVSDAPAFVVSPHADGETTSMVSYKGAHHLRFNFHAGGATSSVTARPGGAPR